MAEKEVNEEEIKKHIKFHKAITKYEQKKLKEKIAKYEREHK